MDASPAPFSAAEYARRSPDTQAMERAGLDASS